MERVFVTVNVRLITERRNELLPYTISCQPRLSARFDSGDFLLDFPSELSFLRPHHGQPQPEFSSESPHSSVLHPSFELLYSSLKIPPNLPDGFCLAIAVVPIDGLGLPWGGFSPIALVVRSERLGSSPNISSIPMVLVFLSYPFCFLSRPLSITGSIYVFAFSKENKMLSGNEDTGMLSRGDPPFPCPVVVVGSVEAMWITGGRLGLVVGNWQRGSI